tara:strand:- start:17103 stop:18230 length:1128 start_codon:yes stop_codon:yes gene_type:complete
MKTFRAKFNPLRKGVYAISLVDEPAMEGDFIAFDKQEEMKLAKVDEEKRLLMGLVLEPNKLVFRKGIEGQEDYQVFFSEQDIEDVAHNFQKQASQSNSTIQHSGKQIEGVTFVEQWIIENPEVDKSTNFGFNYPKGSWMAMMKVDNDDIWNNYVKTGKVNGYSIDALMEFEEVNLNKVNMNDNKEGSVLEFLKDLPNKIALALKPEEVKVELGSVKTADGESVLYFDGETMVSKEAVWLLSEEDAKIPAPVGDHKLEDGKVLVVTEEGIIDSVSEAEVVEEEVIEEVAVEMKVELTKEDITAFEVNLTKVFKTEFEKINDKNIALEKVVKELQGEVKLIGEQPAGTPKKSTFEAVDFSKMTDFQKLKYNEENGLR